MSPDTERGVGWAASCEEAPRGPAGAAADAWAGGEVRWDAYFAVVLAGTLAIVQVAGPATERDRLIASAALLAMVPWYLLTGRRAISASQRTGWLGMVYLAGLILLLAVAEIWVGTVTFILLALCPQCFMAVPYRRAVAAVAALNVTPVLIALAQGSRGADLGTTAGIAALGIAFSVALGTWILKIIDQSAERAELISQLELTRAELADANRGAGILAERERMAGEIHDTIAQGFTSIVMLVQAAEAVIEADPAQARRQLELVDRTARDNLAEARALVAGLGPAPLASGTLADALARLTDRAAQEVGVEAGFAVDGEPRPIGTGAEVVLLRVCQEALSNVRKHAKASSVRVRLTYADGSVRLDVADDGVGFEPAMVSEGYGLHGMRARAGDIGGSLRVRSAPGAGTTVSAEVA